jgi:two-component system response regulator YesN
MLSVLIVEDEPIVAKGLSALINWKEEGYEIVGCMQNGEEALSFLRQQTVDLILSDIKMPLMSGLELLATLRSEKISDAYFVILSGYSDFQYAREALRYDCLEYLLKPVKKEDLLSILRKIVSRREDDQQQQNIEKQTQKACLARNVISLLSNKFDQINVDYVNNHLLLSGEMRYIDLEMKLRQQECQDLTETDKRVLQRELYQHCMDYLGESLSGYCIFDPSSQEDHFNVGFLYCEFMAENKGMSREEYLKLFLDSISSQFNMSLMMFVGKAVEEPKELWQSYRHALMMKEMSSFHISTGNICEELSIKTDSASATILCKDAMDKLVRAIEQNEGEAIEEAADNIYNHIMSLGSSSKQFDLNMNYLLFQLIHLATEQDSHVNQEEIMRYLIANSLDWQIMRGSREHLIKFAKNYGDYLAQLRKKCVRGVLQEIEKEVKENYKTGITLKALSKKYFVNSAYLGQIFQKQFGMSFKDYLNNYRMEQASALLLRTDKKIYEVAEEVGFHDLDYFINRFILVYGCTPTKFRMRSVAV